MNLGVSFAIASVTALRAYDVSNNEQFKILGYLLRDFFKSPLSFVLPTEETAISIAPSRAGEKIEEL